MVTKRELLQRTLQKGIQQRTEQRKRKRDYEKQSSRVLELERKSKKQVSEIDSQIKYLQNQSSNAQGIIAEGQSLAGKQDYEKALAQMKGINFQLEQLRKAKEGLSKGGYYKNLAKGLSQVKSGGSQITSQRYEAWSSAHEQVKAKTGSLPLYQTNLETGERKIVGYTTQEGEKSQSYFYTPKGNLVYAPNVPVFKPTFEKAQFGNIQIKDYKPDISKTEVYDSRTGTYKTAPYGIGAGGTAIDRQPTYQERIKIQEAQHRGSFQEFPPVKFLAGEYEWQKKLDEQAKQYGIKQGTEKPEQDLFGGDYTYKELAKEGAYSTIIRKASADVLGETSIFGAEKITGTKIPEPYRTLTKESIGALGLFYAFSPAMSTGTYSQQQQVVKGEWIYDNVKRKWVRKDKLTGQITRTEAVGEFSRASEERQLEILKKAFRGVKGEKRVYIDESSLLKDIEKSRIFMKEAGLTEAQIQSRISKLFPQLDKVKVPVVQQEGFLIEKPLVTRDISADLPIQIPTRRIGGSVGIDISKVRDVSWVGEGTELKTIQSPFARNIFEDMQLTKQEEQLRQKNLLGLSSVQKAKQETKQLELLKTEQVLREKQPQTAKELLKSLLSFRQKQISRQTQRPVQKETSRGDYLKPKPRPRVPKIPLLFGDSKKKKTSKETLKEFMVFGRRYGEDIELGTFKNQTKAESKLKKFLQETLGASGFVSTKGRKISPKEFGLFSGEEFRLSKVDPLRIVQKRKARLKKGDPQVFEIMRAKKMKWFD